MINAQTAYYLKKEKKKSYFYVFKIQPPHFMH